VDEEACIAVVGTRKSTQTGIEIAFDFCMDMARAGAVIVSGGALGIDTAAHKGALQGGGKTIAVLGCGINYNYLMENASLRAVISQNGALVSEYPPDTPSAASNFPIRNRIISGLSLGTLVIEAAEKSGSLITADLALEQGRDVFAVPGSLKNPVSAGTNNLIKAGAKAVSNAFDILEEYCFLFPQKLHFPEETKDNSKETLPVHKIEKVNTPEHEKPQKEYTKKTNEDFGLSDDAKKLLTSLTAQSRTLPELSEQTGIPVQRLLTAVTELELSGKIEAKSGRRYSLPE
jgi:DNA processing protein